MMFYVTLDGSDVVDNANNGPGIVPSDITAHEFLCPAVPLTHCISLQHFTKVGITVV